MRIIVNEYKYECHCIDQNKIPCGYNQWVLIIQKKYIFQVCPVRVTGYKN